MLKKIAGVFVAVAVAGLFGCGAQKAEPSMLDEISGVWKEDTGQSLMTIAYTDKKVRLLFDDNLVPVTVGDIDETNHTVNFNVVLAATGKSAVWTVREIYNADKTSFTLQMTLNDGTQDGFSFVRKVSTDDLNRIATLDAPPPKADVAATVSTAASSVAPATEATPEKVSAPVQPVSPTPVETSSAPVAPVPRPAQPQAADTQSETPAQPTAFAPSFDCAKVNSGPERLICGSQQLSQLDVELGQAYKRLMADTTDKASLKSDQIEWRKKQRDACSTADCIAKAYQDRIEELDAMSSQLNKPAQFK